MSITQASTYFYNVEIRLQQAIDSEIVSELKSRDQSCATCTFCHRYKYSYKCTHPSKNKVISLYNICAKHKAK